MIALIVLGWAVAGIAAWRYLIVGKRKLKAADRYDYAMMLVFVPLGLISGAVAIIELVNNR